MRWGGATGVDRLLLLSFMQVPKKIHQHVFLFEIGVIFRSVKLLNFLFLLHLTGVKKGLNFKKGRAPLGVRDGRMGHFTPANTAIKLMSLPTGVICTKPLCSTQRWRESFQNCPRRRSCPTSPF